MANYRLPNLFEIFTDIIEFEGNDIDSQVKINHGLNGVPIPCVTRRTDGEGILFQTWADENEITVNFITTPMSGDIITLNCFAILPLK